MNEAAQQKLYAAFQKAKAEFEVPKKTRTVTIRQKEGGKFSFKFADLEEVARCVDKHLLDNWLWVFYTMAPAPDGALITLRLRHTDGGELESTLPIPFAGCGPKEIGGTITYFKRYLKVGLFDLIAEEDNDIDGHIGAPDPEDEAKEAAAREQAETKLASLKKSNRTSAYTGKALAPGENVADTIPPAATAPERVVVTPEKLAAAITGDPAPVLAMGATGDDNSFVDQRLVKVLVGTGITHDDLLQQIERKGYLKGKVEADVTGVCDLPKWFIDQIIKKDNWAKVISDIAAFKKGGK